MPANHPRPRQWKSSLQLAHRRAAAAAAAAAAAPVGSAAAKAAAVRLAELLRGLVEGAPPDLTR